jgi:gamma-glutamylcyclotransferase (GGCT)/AIG2-like uncharacterized protein YtfP
MKVFVYGTLKTGFCRNHALDGQSFLGNCKTKPKYKLFTGGSYPCMVKSEGQGKEIHGELWDVDEDCLRRLDRIEGHPTLFKREQVDIDHPEGATAIAYFWQMGFDDRLREIGDMWDVK